MVVSDGAVIHGQRAVVRDPSPVVAVAGAGDGVVADSAALHGDCAGDAAGSGTDGDTAAVIDSGVAGDRTVGDSRLPLICDAAPAARATRGVAGDAAVGHGQSAVAPADDPAADAVGAVAGDGAVNDRQGAAGCVADAAASESRA